MGIYLSIEETGRIAVTLEGPAFDDLQQVLIVHITLLGRIRNFLKFLVPLYRLFQLRDPFVTC